MTTSADPTTALPWLLFRPTPLVERRPAVSSQGVKAWFVSVEAAPDVAVRRGQPVNRGWLALEVAAAAGAGADERGWVVVGDGAAVAWRTRAPHRAGEVAASGRDGTRSLGAAWACSLSVAGSSPWTTITALPAVREAVVAASRVMVRL
jgi:hypothetical protein